MLTWLIPTTVEAGGSTYSSAGSTIIDVSSASITQSNAEGITENESITVLYNLFQSNNSTNTFNSGAGATTSFVGNSYFTAASSSSHQVNTATNGSGSGSAGSLTTLSGSSSSLGSSTATTTVASTARTSFPYSYLSSETTSTSSRGTDSSATFSTSTTQTRAVNSTYNNVGASAQTSLTTQQTLVGQSYPMPYGNATTYATGYAAQGNEVGFIYSGTYSVFPFAEASFKSFTGTTMVLPMNSFAIAATEHGDTSYLYTLLTDATGTADTHLGSASTTSLEGIHFTNAWAGEGTFSTPPDATQAVIRRTTTTTSHQDTTVISEFFTYPDARQYYSVAATLATTSTRTLTLFLDASTVQAGSGDTYTGITFGSDGDPATTTFTNWATYDSGFYSTTTSTTSYNLIVVTSDSSSTIGGESHVSGGVTTAQQYIGSLTAYGIASVWSSSPQPTAMLKQPNMGFLLDPASDLYRGIGLGTLNPGILLSNIYSTAEIVPVVFPSFLSTTWDDGSGLSYSISFDSASSLYITTGSTAPDGTSTSTQTGSVVTSWSGLDPVTEMLFYTTQGDVADTGSYASTFTAKNSILLPPGAFSNSAGSTSYANGSLIEVTTLTTVHAVPMITATPGGVFWLTA